MPLISKELLEQKLTSWVASSQVTKVLGFTEEQEAIVKEELNTLAALGIVDRDGVKRGLKYRLSGIVDPEPSTEDEELSENEAAVDRSVQGYKRARDLIFAETKNKSFYELLEWITNVSISQDPYLTSMTLAVKKNSDGSIAIRTYAAISQLHEVVFDNPEKFVKFLHKSITPTSNKESN